MSELSAQTELARVLRTIHAPGVMLPPWKIETRAGGEMSARKLSIGIMGGCIVEHDHDGDNDNDACVLTEFAVVWNNDSRLPATHVENSREVATARALVAAFNFLARHGTALLHAGPFQERASDE